MTPGTPSVQECLTVWLTGLPAAGKSTLAASLRERLTNSGWPTAVLDGDEIRRGLSADLGYSAADRTENTRRVAQVALLLARTGIVSVVSMISPYRADREQARLIHADAGVRFVEVWVATPLVECERRDPKGLYGRARRGEVAGVTGIDAPYEPPDGADIVIDTTNSSKGDAAEQVLRGLRLGR